MKQGDSIQNKWHNISKWGGKQSNSLKTPGKFNRVQGSLNV